MTTTTKVIVLITTILINIPPLGVDELTMTINIAISTIPLNLLLLVVRELPITIAITTQSISMNLPLLVKTNIYHCTWIWMMELLSNIPFKSVLATTTII